jgi:hypothetical protein
LFVEWKAAGDGTVRPICQDAPLLRGVPSVLHDSWRDSPASCPIVLDHLRWIKVGRGEIVGSSDAILARFGSLSRQFNSSSSAIVSVWVSGSSGHLEQGQIGEIGGIVSAGSGRVGSLSLVTKV